MAPSYVELFTGAGGLSLGLEAAGWEPMWFSENAKPCRKVLAERWPDVPVRGDVTELEQGEASGSPDLLAGGFPCQDLSYAGKRAGLEGDRSGLWYAMAAIIRDLQPRMALVENVPGLMRPVAGGSGVAPIGVVLGDLAELGYDARWGRLRACDVGAPHIRSRVFIVAWRRVLANPGGRGAAGDAGTVPRAQEERGRLRAQQGHSARDPGQDDPDGDGGRRECVGEPQPTRLEGKGRNEPDRSGPAGQLKNAATTYADPDADESYRDEGQGFGQALREGIDQPLEPGGSDRGGQGGPGLDWGIYAAAIQRWEHLTRPAPHCLDERGRLNPRFCEWMLGFPDGWVDVKGVSRTAQIRMLGNACQVQCAEALAWHLRDIEAHLA